MKSCVQSPSTKVMVFVGIVFVINSLDSLIRLYTDNLNMSAQRLGKGKYFVINFVALCALTLLFKIDFLQIQWVGALVIGLFYCCLSYILYSKLGRVRNIDSSPKENELDFKKIDTAH